MHEREIINLRSASQHRLETLGIVTLTVKIADMTIRTPFFIVRQLGADMILGTTFIDAHCEILWIRKHPLLLGNGIWESVQKCAAISPSIIGTREPTQVKPPRPREELVQVAARITLQPRSETVVKAVTVVTGEKILSSRDKLYQKRQVAMTDGIVKVQTHLPFLAKVLANFSDEPVQLKKNQLLGTYNPAPDSVLSVPKHEERREILRGCQEDVNIVEQQCPPACKAEDGGHPGQLVPASLPAIKLVIPPAPTPPDVGGEGIWPLFRSALEDVTPGVHTRSPEADRPPSLDDVDLSHLDTPVQTNVRKMLKEFESMWNGRHGVKRGVQHRISLSDGSRPVAMAPRQAGPQDREIVLKEVERMLEEGVICEAQSEWAAPEAGRLPAFFY